MSCPNSRTRYAALAAGLVLLLVLPNLAIAGGASFIGPLTHIDEVASASRRCRVVS